MSAVSKSYTFVPGTDIESAEANQNFDDLVDYVNGEVIVRDASKAFTAIPAGPGTDPTSPNQFARKQYVDNADNLRAKLDGTTPFTGIPSGPATNPTTDDQFTRKKYVNDQDALRPTMAATGQIIKASEFVPEPPSSTNIYGELYVPFATPFPTAVDTIVVTSGDAGVPTQFISIVSKTLAGFTVRCFTVDVVNPFGAGLTVNRAVSQAVRVNYIAIGR